MDPRTVNPGARFTVSVVARIDAGWHLYATKQSSGGLISTRVWIAEGQLFQSVGPLKGSEPETILDPNFNMEVGFYGVLPDLQRQNVPATSHGQD
jgi:hypothetical protein